MLKVTWGRGRVLTRAQVPNPIAWPRPPSPGEEVCFYGHLRYWRYSDGRLVAYIRWTGRDRREVAESWIEDDEPDHRPKAGAGPLHGDGRPNPAW